MDLEITPEPPPREREAVERALTRLLGADPRDVRSAWWREGVRESVRFDDDAYAGWRPRNNRGATRA